MSRKKQQRGRRPPPRELTHTFFGDVWPEVIQHNHVYRLKTSRLGRNERGTFITATYVRKDN